MVKTPYVEFISECRKRGLEDWQIRKAIVDDGLSEKDLEDAFDFLKAEQEKKLKEEEEKDEAAIRSKGEPEVRYRNALTVRLDDAVMKAVEKRAKKNMMSTQEQCEDIIRRSCVNMKKASNSIVDDADDLLIRLFSRKTQGRPRKEIR